MPLSGGSGSVVFDCLVRKMKAPFRYHRPCLHLAGGLGRPERLMVTSVKTPRTSFGFTTHVICTTWVVNVHRSERTTWIALLVWRQRYGLDVPWFGSHWRGCGGEIVLFSKRPDRLLGPSRLLFNGYRGQFQAVKRPAQ